MSGLSAEVITICSAAVMSRATLVDRTASIFDV